MHYIGMDAKQPVMTRHAQFPILEESLYVNHATLSPWPRDTLLAVREYAEEHHRQGPLVYRKWLRIAERLRQAAANLLNAPSPADISLLTNTTDGINTLVQGLDWREGDNVVTLDRDFPSNVLPWHALRNQGVRIRTANARGAPDAEAALLERVDERTRVLAISSVDWIDGFRLDLARLGAACRPSGVILFVDAIQHLGALRLDVQAEQVDVLAAGSHKWQLGPEGMGVFYTRKAIREQLRPSRLGWHMLEDRFDFTRPGRKPAEDGRKFEAGTPSRLGQVALNASLQVLQEYGMEQVEARILDNTARLIAGLGDMGLALLSSSDPLRRSGIVTFSAPSADGDRLLAELATRSVHAIRRGRGIRLSPHFYQGAEEMNRLLARIEEAVHCVNR